MPLGLTAWIPERLGAKIRQKSEETNYFQSQIIEMALEEYFSPAQEDERMIIVNERLEYLGKGIRAIEESLPSAIRTELKDDFAKLNNFDMNEKYLKEITSDLRNRLTQSEKLRGEDRKTIKELRECLNRVEKDCLQKQTMIKSTEEQHKKLMAVYDDCIAENKKWGILWEAEKKTIGGKLNRLFYNYTKEE